MEPELVRPVIAEKFPGLTMAQSTRYGGISEGLYASLNLGLSTGDEREAVEENRRRFWSALGTSEAHTAGGYQVHGSEIKVVDKPGYYDGHDAFVTDQPDLFLDVTVADCVPVLIFDPVKKAIAAIHAGWRGTVEQITGKTVALLQKAYGTNPADCIAYIGTCIGFDSFEVSAEVAREFAPELQKEAGSPGKHLVDLKEANRRQLLQAGMTDEFIEVSPFCTVADHHRFFSFRKEGGVTGRMLAVIGMRF
ncbi:MAG: hypothetical protein ABS46_11880 [Cytophagaceae bacterium SCN 52-12]|nr:MAG: hypothetical protein ABS46_11880 [Cytophagaceae bacterium SCN 52-12]